GVPFESSEVRFDSAQALLLLADGLLDLGSADPQHAPELFDRRVLLENVANLLQGEAQFAQGHYPVEPAQLAGSVKPVSVGRVDLVRREQADLVVVAQHPGDTWPSRANSPMFNMTVPSIRLHIV